ncbi:MAG: D-alanyl-D-alanine carboxypeptidase [Alphaproteobacteria bacterium]
MRKLSALFAIFSLLFVFSANAAEYNATLVADMDSGRVLYSENSNDLNYPASLTKIMTLYLTFDALEHGRLKLDDYLIVSKNAANASPVKLGLSAGSKIKVEDAIKALAVHSANDVSRVLAENLKGGKEGNFASLMTQVANQIGLSKTNFENSSGLPDDDHLSNARDIALMSMAVYKHFPGYWKYFGIKTWSYNGKTYNNGNPLLKSYSGCDGMKTGYTNKSKYSLVATASRNGHHLIAVVLGAKNKDVRATVATQMLDKGFKVVGAKSDTPVSKVTTQKIETYTSKVVEVKPQTYVVSDGYGVQFGAFSARLGAEEQAKKVNKITGANAVLEEYNGLFRVRKHGLPESMAQNICSSVKTQGIDCFVFSK